MCSLPLVVSQSRELRAVFFADVLIVGFGKSSRFELFGFSAGLLCGKDPLVIDCFFEAELFQCLFECFLFAVVVSVYGKVKKFRVPKPGGL